MGRALNSPLRGLSDAVPVLALPPQRPSLAQVLRSRWTRRIAVAAACVLILTIIARRNYKLIDYYFIHNETLPNHPYDGSVPFKQYEVASNVAAAPSLVLENADWSRFAYIQYATDGEYLCNSLAIFESLHRLGSLAGRVLMYPEHMLDPSATRGETKDAKLILKARDEYNVTLMPITVLRQDTVDTTWATSYTKLLAFNATQYDRVLALDSDSLLYQHMDELFLLPPSPVAMPRAYWLYPQNILSSQLVLLQPSAAEFQRITDTFDDTDENDYDMEILNEIYGDNAMVLPHRRYDLMSAEFRGEDHRGYLGSDREAWDPVAAVNEAKYVHFSDWPVPKPWLATPEAMAGEQPRCHGEGEEKNCSDRDIWNGLYSDFQNLRKRVCSV